MMQSEGASVCRKPTLSGSGSPNRRYWLSLKPVLKTHNLPPLDIKEPS